MPGAISNLREIARICLAGQRMEAELAAWLGKALSDYLDHRAASLQDALGLRMPKGGVPWWREEAMRRRDEALRELARLHFPQLSVAAQARRIGELARRYGAASWRFDRALSECPRNLVGTQLEQIWRAFKAGAPLPLGERQLRQILARAHPRPTAKQA